MARSGQLLNFILKALNSNKYVNLKWYDEKRRLFLLKCPNKRNKCWSPNYSKIFDDWHDLKERSVYNYDRRSRLMNALKKRFKLCDEHPTKCENIYEIPKGYSKIKIEPPDEGMQETPNSPLMANSPLAYSSSNNYFAETNNALKHSNVQTTLGNEVNNYNFQENGFPPEINVGIPNTTMNTMVQVYDVVKGAYILVPLTIVKKNSDGVEISIDTSQGILNTSALHVSLNSESNFSSAGHVAENQNAEVGMAMSYDITQEMFNTPVPCISPRSESSVASSTAFESECCLKSPGVSPVMLGNQDGCSNFLETFTNLQKYSDHFHHRVSPIPAQNAFMGNDTDSEMHTAVSPESEMFPSLSEGVLSPSLESDTDGTTYLDFSDLENPVFDDTFFNELLEGDDSIMNPKTAINPIECDRPILHNMDVSEVNTAQQHIEPPVSACNESATMNEYIRGNHTQDSFMNTQEQISFPQVICNEISTAVNGVVSAYQNGNLMSDPVSQQNSDTTLPPGRILNKITYLNRTYVIALVEA